MDRWKDEGADRRVTGPQGPLKYARGNRAHAEKKVKKKPNRWNQTHSTEVNMLRCSYFYPQNILLHKYNHAKGKNSGQKRKCFLVYFKVLKTETGVDSSAETQSGAERLKLNGNIVQLRVPAAGRALKPEFILDIKSTDYKWY